MASGEIGAFEWGAAEWGGLAEADAGAEASGSFDLAGSAVGSLLLAAQASGSFDLNGSATGTVGVVSAQASGVFDLDGSAVATVISSVLRPTRFNIDSSLQQPSDQWEAEFPGPEEYEDIDPDRTVNLEIGLEDALGVPQAIRTITAGIVDEYRLELQRDAQISHLKGRDAGAALLEEEFSTLYQRFPGQAVTSQVGVTIKVGIFRARQVAEEIILSAGLTPAWQTRDYELWDDFDATGRKIDILQRLVQPWCSVEPSKVDIFVEGTTVYLRDRKAFPAAADYVLAYDKAGSAPHAKCLNVNIRKVRLPIYGEVSLLGRDEPAHNPSDFDPPEGEPGVATQTVEIIPFQQTVGPDGGVSFTPGKLTQRSASRSYQNGQIVALVETISVYQIPNQVLLETTKNTYAFTEGVSKLIKTEVKGSTFQEFTYDAKGPTNSPLPLTEYTRVFSYIEETLPSGLTATVFKQNSDETTTYAYDRDNYLTTASTLKRVDRDGALVEDTLIVKHYQDTGPLSYQIQTDRYVYQDQTVNTAISGEVFDGEGPVDTGNLLLQSTVRVPVLVSSDETPASGHRPGGPNRPPQKPIGTDFTGVITLPLNRVNPGSTDPRAQRTTAGGRNMSAADLAYIQGQHDEASGLYEAELSFTVLSMPHIKRGSIIQLTGIVDQDDVPIQVATGFAAGVTGLALVYDLSMEYDEPGRRSVSDIKAVWWEPAP